PPGPDTIAERGCSLGSPCSRRKDRYRIIVTVYLRCCRWAWRTPGRGHRKQDGPQVCQRGISYLARGGCGSRDQPGITECKPEHFLRGPVRSGTVPENADDINGRRTGQQLTGSRPCRRLPALPDEGRPYRSADPGPHHGTRHAPAAPDLI